MKDHVKSKKHAARKEAKKARSSTSVGPSTSRQMRLGTVVKSRDLREKFVLDYVKMCTLADIPLEKTEKIRPLLDIFVQVNACCIYIFVFSAHNCILHCTNC